MTTTALSEDLALIDLLTFNRGERMDKLMADIHEIIAMKELEGDRPVAERLRRWLKISYTLWPIDFFGLGEHICAQLRALKALDEKIKHVLDHLEQVPPIPAQELVAKKDHDVRAGKYDPFGTPDSEAKFAAAEKAMRNNVEFKEAWADFCARHPERTSAKPVLRRLMRMERNFTPTDWKFKYHEAYDWYQIEMDALCARFCLYGVEKGVPLLQKLTVNATPFGLMIFIPRYWSLDYKRDFNWKEIIKLLKAWGALRQGKKWSGSRLENEERAKCAYRASLEGQADGLTGKELLNHVRKKIGWSENADDSNLRKLINKGEALVAKAKKSRQTN